MAKFDELLNELRDGIIQIAKTEAIGFVEEAKSDGQAFLAALQADLKTWTEQLAAGKLSPDDFKFLIRGKQDLARMNALTEAGLAAIRIDRIRSAVIDLIITVASKAIAL
jgi:hypothetical protein